MDNGCRSLQVKIFGDHYNVAGWGFTKESMEPAKELKKLLVNVANRRKCKEYLPVLFEQRYFTHDKLCAGYANHTVCSGDSGGGLYFQHNYLYYVRGIVSVSPPTASGGCSTLHYALYTNVSEHLQDIGQQTGRVL